MEIKQAIANAFDEEVAALQGLLRIKSVEALGENGTVFGQGAADCLAYVLKRGRNWASPGAMWTAIADIWNTARARSS